jgi:hypothetical protein
MVVKIIRRNIINRMNLTVLEVEDMGFIVGKSSTESGLKLHLLRLEMQLLYQDVKICDLAL